MAEPELPMNAAAAADAAQASPPRAAHDARLGDRVARWCARHWLAIVSHAAFVLLWWIASHYVPRFILPSPIDTVATLSNARYNWPRHALATGAEIFGGFSLALLVGVSLAVAF